ncbi:DUF4157 domain-containing protein [Streptacidiphilus sp. PB12-B1b]|uniref:eCIS core domain-containing protein n=1 Tax=Streptacidiphilus sp. PB12-B1b TaxID=2705012 RepID=UPI001CDB7D6D|nr:DUF4157 domain-containing protein [Streptacidiphilus sp. PB12-B1b]
MRAQDTVRTHGSGLGSEYAGRTPLRTPAGGPSAVGGAALSPQYLLALQRAAGNAATVQLLRGAGQPGAQERHQHGAGCGHQPSGPQASGRPPVQRSTVHDVLRGGGRPLDDATRTDMEARLGADFSDVRLHTGTTAQRSAAEVGARAYTSGNHVVIGDGGADKHTLAHELTHVIQQRQGPVAGTDNGNGLNVSDPSDRFEREAEANATRALSGPVRQPAQQESRAERAEGGGAGPVQRALPTIQRARLSSGSIAFTNVSMKYPQYSDKAQRILQLLTSHSAITQYINGRRCDITLEKRALETPADVTDKGADGVDVKLAAYYFEQYDIGYIAGMLCHEFGIHPLAEAKPGLAGEEEGFKGMPFPVPGLESEQREPDGFASMNSATAKQSDHVLGAIPGAPRFTVYRDVTLEMADLLLRDVHDQQPNAHEQDVRDLLDCFLMDIASIAATNDDRKRGAPVIGNSEGESVRGDIARVYNAYKQRLLAELSPERQQRIAPLFPQDKTPAGVKSDFQALMTRIAKGALWAWSIDNSNG